ncbi:hypothetical protein [Pseudescherichia sp.]|uniref:hypothetical protein n=1 Tax=Pseudescherichia sp. TaxID=2055881 RepID=UPI002897BB82|nr:hypothetical protein [Pseudescherichia sp.]
MYTPVAKLKLEEICGVNQRSCLVETPAGYAIIQPDITPLDGARVLVAAFGQLQFAVLMDGVLITEDGESIENSALEDVNVLGVVTFYLNGAGVYTDENPVL